MSLGSLKHNWPETCPMRTDAFKVPKKAECCGRRNLVFTEWSNYATFGFLEDYCWSYKLQCNNANYHTPATLSNTVHVGFSNWLAMMKKQQPTKLLCHFSMITNWKPENMWLKTIQRYSYSAAHAVISHFFFFHPYITLLMKVNTEECQKVNAYVPEKPDNRSAASIWPTLLRAVNETIEQSSLPRNTTPPDTEEEWLSGPWGRLYALDHRVAAVTLQVRLWYNLHDKGHCVKIYRAPVFFFFYIGCTGAPAQNLCAPKFVVASPYKAI